MEIHADMVNTLRDDALGLSTVQKWAAEFKRRRKSLQDDPRFRQPATATTPEIIDHVHQIVMGERQLTTSDIAKEVDISREQVENILHKKLGMFKVFLLNGCHGS